MRIVAFPHSVLTGLARPGKRIWNWPVGIRTALALPSSPSLRLVALSQTIYQAITEEVNPAPWRRLDHPYLFDRHLDTNPNRSNGRLRIGLFGSLRTPLSNYCRLLAAVAMAGAQAEFVMVGHIRASARQHQALSPYLKGASTVPISYSRLEELASGVDYVLQIPDPIQHRYAVSSSLLDAFNHGKPGFFLLSPLLEEYRARFGDFGYFCQSLDALAEIIAEASRKLLGTAHSSQRLAIARARPHFEPRALAGQLRAVVET